MSVLFALGALICCGVSGWYSWRAIAAPAGSLWNAPEGADPGDNPVTLPDAARFNRAATVWNMFAAALGALASLSLAVSAMR